MSVKVLNQHWRTAVNVTFYLGPVVGRLVAPLMMSPSDSPGPLMSPVLDIVSAPALICRGLESVAVTPVLVIWIHPLTYSHCPLVFLPNYTEITEFLQIIDQQKLNSGNNSCCQDWLGLQETQSKILIKTTK